MEKDIWKHVPAKDLFVGEMILDPGNESDAGMLHGPYYKVVGHKHEEQKVLIKYVNLNVNLMCSGQVEEISYFQTVSVRPFAYKHIRSELLKDWNYYKQWPYDENGDFCDPPRDYSNWKEDYKED